MPNSAAERIAPLPPHAGRWAPVWVIVFVALWPAPGLAESVLSLGAVFAIWRLLRRRFGGGTQLLSGAAWALTSVLFLAYWIPELLSAFDAIDVPLALRKSVTDLRYLPFMWLCAIAVADPVRRRRTFAGLAIIGGVWTVDALLQALSGTSPVFWSMDQLKWAISGHGLCTAQEMAAVDRLSGLLGPCNLKFGQTLASLSPFLLFAAAARGRLAWGLVALACGAVVVMAGARAAWITYALVLLCSGWRLIGGRGMLAVAAAAVVGTVLLFQFSPQVHQRVVRLQAAVDGGLPGVDAALSGRTQIWSAALCMVREHPLNGVGARGFREAYPQCDPHPEQLPAWGEGPAFHAHQIVLEILAETGFIGLLLWLAGAAQAWRAWRYSSAAARDQARPAMVALLATVFPLNTHLAFYSSFWGGLTLMLAALYAGALLNEDRPADA